MQYRLDEQETAINYDNQTGKWHIYSTFGPHARKWEKALVPGARKEYTKKNGTLIMIDGDLRDDYYLTVTKRRKMSEEQRLAAAERLRRLRDGK